MILIEFFSQMVGNVGAIVDTCSVPLRLSNRMLAAVGTVCKAACAVEPLDGFSSPGRE